MARLAALLPVILALASLACGGDDGNGPSPTVPPVEGTVDPLGFGSLGPETIKANPDPPAGVSVLTDVRMGAHPEQGGWDRIVFEFRDSLPAGRIEYVEGVYGCGSGLPVTVRGEAFLRIQFQPAYAHDEDAGRPTIKAREMQGPGHSILEAEITCDFEADVTWAIGVTGRQRFKVTRLTNPTRLVIDVKW